MTVISHIKPCALRKCLKDIFYCLNTAFTIIQYIDCLSLLDARIPITVLRIFVNLNIYLLNVDM